LSVFCLLDYSKSYEQILMNFLEGGVWPKDQSIRFYWVGGGIVLNDTLFTIVIPVDSQE